MPNCHICGKSDIAMLCVCGECREPSKATNADKIRAMSDEELAAMLYSFEDLNMPDYCQRKKECDDMLDADIDIPAENCKRCLVEYLRQPAKEE
jgi:hypothetical protein